MPFHLYEFNMKEQWFVIINPTSGNGAASKKWPYIKETLRNHSFNFIYKKTEYHQHAIELAVNAVDKGFTKIIAVGGDGTFHEVVNGILKSKMKNKQEIKLGIIPVGTGNDWVKTYNISTNYKEAIAIITNDYSTKQDIGKLTISETNEVVYFNNLAGIGFDAYVVKKIAHYKNFGFLAYLIAGILSIINFKKPGLTIDIGSKRVVTNQKSLTLLIGICKYCGGGMRLTKDVHPEDGLFDITYVEHFGFFNILANLHNIFNGKLCDHYLVKTFKSNTVNITCKKTQNTYIQADGEKIGKGSFTVSTIKSPINFIIPDPSKS